MVVPEQKVPSLPSSVGVLLLVWNSGFAMSTHKTHSVSLPKAWVCSGHALPLVPAPRGTPTTSASPPTHPGPKPPLSLSTSHAKTESHASLAVSGHPEALGSHEAVTHPRGQLQKASVAQ